MTARQVTSERLVDLYLARIAARSDRLASERRRLHQSKRCYRRASVGRRTQVARPTQPAARHPGSAQGQLRNQGYANDGGSLALRDVVPPRDAFQVAQLRRAGAVLLGKVNLHELALGLTSISSLGGQTRNPYDVTHHRAARVVAQLGCGCMLRRLHAGHRHERIDPDSELSHNSLVGLRPSAGLSSRAGIIPFGHTQDTGGPMARTVEDIALILDETVGYDPADPTTQASAGRIPRSYTTSLKQGSLKNARIGVLAEFFGSAPEDEGSLSSCVAESKR